MKLKNKKGFAFGLIMVLIIIAVIFLLGAGATFKVISTLKSIPKPLWYLIIFILILLILKDRKK